MQTKQWTVQFAVEVPAEATLGQVKEFVAYWLSIDPKRSPSEETEKVLPKCLEDYACGEVEVFPC